jgi:hypothetical protein
MMKTKLTLFVTVLTAALFGVGCVSTVSNQPTFKVIEGRFNFAEAMADAELKGGRLAVLDTKEKIEHMKSYVQNYKDKGRAVKVANAFHFWIGLTDRIKEGEWRWINGTRLDEHDWAGTEPNGNGDTGNGSQDFGVIMGPGGRPQETGWHDDKGANRYSYVIEFPVQPKK